MVNAWEVATIVAVVAGVVGFFVVLRGSAFPAHAIPNGAFAGAAGANLIGVDPLLGLGVFSLLAALAISSLGRRGRPDVATALALVMMLALGDAFLSQTREFEPQILALLFGDLFGVATLEILPVAVLGVVCVLAIAALYRPLMLTSLVPEVAQARGIRPHLVDTAFLIVVACATTMTVPVVGALLIFALMIGPPAAARCCTRRPGIALGASVGLALIAVWASIACAYLSNWPVGFFVGTFCAAMYAIGRLYEGIARAWPRRSSRATSDARGAASAVALDAANHGR